MTMSKIDIIWRKWIKLFIFGLLFINNSTVYVVSAEGNIGCLFADTLCLDNLEWCYDDFAFGKCLPQFGLDSEDLFREPLDASQTRLLATMLEELQGAGLDWQHIYTQCRLQGALYALRTKTDMPNNLCANLAPDPEILDPQSPMAFVRFTPPNNEFADEVYYPPLKRTFTNDRSKAATVYYPDPVLEGFGSRLEEEILERQHEQAEELREQEALENRMKDIRNRIELRQMLAAYEAGNLKPPIYRSDQLFDGPDEQVGEDAIVYSNDRNRINDDEQKDYKRTDSYFKEHQKALERDALEEVLEEMIEENANVPKQTAFREVAQAEHIPIAHLETPEVVDFEKNEIPNWMMPAKLHKGHRHSYEPDNYLPSKSDVSKFSEPSSEGGVYTEGGLVYVPGSNNREEARNLLEDMLGFTRHERLDVKKPGPPPLPPPIDQKVGDKEVVPVHMKVESVAKIKKILPDHADETHAVYSVDTDYAHVMFKSPIDNWNNGTRIVAALAEMLNMKDYISHPRVDRYEVSFKVEPNPEKKTATDVARQINDPRFQTNLSRRLGVTVKQAGVGDKTKAYDGYSVLSSKIEKADDGPNVTHVMAYLFAGAGAAALVVIGITLLLIKKHDKKRDKLGGLQAGLSAAESCTKDYQDLCRARMAGKGNDSPGGRVASLSKDAEAKPPSSRSSTSSWSEEPALTNMDISTGHMVLSYMEDHLRNKGRLQREWEALCRYEAEPGAREAALQPQCVPLNRLTAPLPFDHSRVVLNHLANAEGMDYINASSITDHDPRAPAYVAAQGPLTTTLAHFWQMVWEQGAVVLVSLCRLQENGENNCTRYWPEEGAEVYHIYEVHLVSEHIWCDDYLVRSFYLKNLRTGETRTVTQFHFLSWPQGGVPTSAKALLEFRRKVNKSYRGRSCPIIVHSSNGAGRTGAYILLDLVLGRMNKGAREIDIAATLEHLRDQRAGLVATRQQFEFVLMAVAEEVHAILKALPQNEKREPEKREIDKETTKDKAETESEKPIDKTEEK